MKTFIVTIKDDEMKEWRECMSEDGAIEAEKSDEYAIKAALELHELSCTVQEVPTYPEPNIKLSEEQEVEDHSDDICPCGDPDCSRPFGHAEE